MKTWTKAKIVHLKSSRRQRWDAGQKYLPLHRKLWRALKAFCEAAGTTLIVDARKGILPEEAN
jgi:hypothetical protein